MMESSTHIKKLARRLTLASYHIDESYFINEKKRRIPRAEFNIMYALDDGKPHSQTELSRDWLVPKTTVNTIIKQWERTGYAVQEPVPGKRREMQIFLTKKGKEYVKEYTGRLYRVEERALKKTIDKYSDEFIDAMEYFAQCLRREFEEEDKT